MRVKVGSLRPVAASVSLGVSVLTALMAPSLAFGDSVKWLGGNGNWAQASKWTGGAVPNSSIVSVLIDDDPTTHSAVVVDGTAIAAGLTLGAGDSITVRRDGFSGDLYVYGPLVNDGTIFLQAGTTLQARGGSVAGSGAVVMQTASIADITSLGSNQSIRGVGFINVGTASPGLKSLQNQGLIRAEGGDLAMGMGSTGQRIDNAAGILQIANNAGLIGYAKITGGLIQGEGNAQIDGLHLQNVSLTGDIQVVRRYMGGLKLSGTITNAGTLSMVAPSDNFGSNAINLYGDTVFAGTGRTSFIANVGGSGNEFDLGGHQLTIAQGYTFEGAGNLGSASGGQVINHGRLLASGGAFGVGAPLLDNSDGLIEINTDASFGIYGQMVFSKQSEVRLHLTDADKSPNGLYGSRFFANNGSFAGALVADLGSSVAAVGDTFYLASYNASQYSTFDSITIEGYEIAVTYANYRVVATITGIAPVPEAEPQWMLALGLATLLAVRRFKRAA
jgi:hypothetical protein